MTVKVSLLDLTVDQELALEAELGAPLKGWNDLSNVLVMSRVYAIVTGEDAGKLTLRELTEAVSLGEEDEPPEGTEDAETANPT